MNEPTQAIAVRVGSRRFAVPLEQVAEVIDTPELHPVPARAAELAGVVAVRSALHPVVDLGIRFDGTAAAGDRLLIVRAAPGAEAVALRVDDVEGIVRGGVSGRRARTAEPVRGVLRVAGGEPIPLLDLGRLLG